MTGKSRFEIAAEDKAAAASGDVYQLEIFDLPGPVTDGPDESYAAVRPADDGWLALARSAFTAKRDERSLLVGGMQFLDLCFTREDLYDALVQTGEYADDPEHGDGDGTLTAAGLLLADSNARINSRMMDRHDPFGHATLTLILHGLTEAWSGNPTGSLPGSLKPPRRRGGSSTAAVSSTVSTSPRSSTSRRRVS